MSCASPTRAGDKFSLNASDLLYELPRIQPSNPKRFTLNHMCVLPGCAGIAHAFDIFGPHIGFMLVPILRPSPHEVRAVEVTHVTPACRLAASRVKRIHRTRKHTALGLMALLCVFGALRLLHPTSPTKQSFLPAKPEGAPLQLVPKTPLASKIIRFNLTYRRAFGIAQKRRIMPRVDVRRLVGHNAHKRR